MKIITLHKLLVLLAVLGCASFSKAQSTNDILVSAGNDLFRTDLPRIFSRAQFAAEGNYFVVRHFAVGLGAEFWTHRTNSFVMGARWYVDEKIFIRVRGLIGANDAEIGAGWSQPLNKVWRLEAIGDYYFRGNFGLRAGISYVIHRN